MQLTKGLTTAVAFFILTTLGVGLGFLALGAGGWPGDSAQAAAANGRAVVDQRPKDEPIDSAKFVRVIDLAGYPAERPNFGFGVPIEITAAKNFSRRN